MISTLAAAVIAASTMMSPMLSSVTLSTDTLANQTRIESSAVEIATTVTDAGSMWKKGKYAVEGAFRFEERDDGTYLVIESDFKTKKGPDLKFVLSPTDYTSVKAKTALKGGLIVGKLKSITGAQEFKLPAGTNASSYKSLLVHCEAKTKLWASAPINSGNLVAHGASWQKKSSKITGHWEIAKTDAGLVLHLGSDFKTKKMPDLLLILSPMDMKSISGKNAASGGIEFATLSNTKGQSEYLIKGVDSLDGYKSLVIHCEEYSKCWGGTAIN